MSYFVIQIFFALSCGDSSTVALQNEYFEELMDDEGSFGT